MCDNSWEAGRAGHASPCSTTDAHAHEKLHRRKKIAHQPADPRIGILVCLPVFCFLFSFAFASSFFPFLFFLSFFFVSLLPFPKKISPLFSTDSYHSLLSCVSARGPPGVSTSPCTYLYEERTPHDGSLGVGGSTTLARQASNLAANALDAHHSRSTAPGASSCFPGPCFPAQAARPIAFASW